MVKLTDWINITLTVLTGPLKTQTNKMNSLYLICIALNHVIMEMATFFQEK